jgi:hypothetical protein
MRATSGAQFSGHSAADSYFMELSENSLPPPERLGAR